MVLTRRLAALLLLATALAGGPGFAGLEAYEHAHRTVPGHGHRIHVEPRGGQDHDDGCGAWLRSAPVRTPAQPSGVIRLVQTVTVQLTDTLASHVTHNPALLPLSRAPPATV